MAPIFRDDKPNLLLLPEDYFLVKPVVQRGGQEEVRVKADGGDVGGQLPLLQIQPESRHHTSFNRQVHLDSSVADPGWMFIPDPNYPSPGPKRFRIPDPDPHQRVLTFLTQKIVSKLSDI
jgi:hypothetical protein